MIDPMVLLNCLENNFGLQLAEKDKFCLLKELVKEIPNPYMED